MIWTHTLLMVWYTSKCVKPYLPTASRYPCQQEITSRAQTARIPRTRKFSRPLVSQDTTHIIHFCCWRFWSKVLWKRTRQSPDLVSQTKQIQTHQRLDGKLILWNITKLELQSRVRWYLHARIHQEKAPWIWTSIPQEDSNMPILTQTKIIRG